MSAPTKAVGVIGGLGPEATLDFFQRILKRTKALRDQDHIRLIIDNNPHIPDRNLAAQGKGPSPGPALAAAARGLETAGAEIVVMACNAAHAWESDIRAAIRVPFISILQVTVEGVAALQPRPAKVGVLAADAALRTQLYQRALLDAGFDPLTLPDDRQAQFMETLYRIKAGDTGETSRASYRQLTAELVAAGAGAVIAGCTEVPLVLSQRDVTVPLVSSTDALVERVIIAAGAELLP